MRNVFEPSLEALKVTVVGSGSPTVPNVVRLTNGTDYLTTTMVGSNVGLDVNILNALEISISHLTDSIRIGDGTGYITSTVVGPIRALDVNLASGNVTGSFKQTPSGTTALTYGISTVAISASAFVCTYTVPAGPPVYLQRIYVSGESIAKWTIYKNATILMVARMTYTDFSRTIDFMTGSAFGVATVPGDIIKVEVENVSNGVADFDASIQTMNT
jgi:hypothetical protein